MESIKKILSLIMIFSLFSFSFILSLSTSEAHILVIGDSNNDLPDFYNKAVEVANKLKNQGYEVLELYGEDATTKNILKGMYDADAVIYIGHGGYQSGNYNGNGGTATPPFAIVGSNGYIWGIGDKMREGWSSPLFYAPFKQNIPVILLHACFSTGWVGNKEVANPVETIYNFASMFVGANANYYASAYGDEIIDDFLNGATNFADANNKNYEKIVTSTLYSNTLVWRNDHGHTAFVGDWSGVFPSVASTTAYDDAAAEAWYNSDRTRKICFSKFSINSSPYYVNQAIKFTDLSSPGEKRIVNYHWNFGDGKYQSSSSSINPSHTYSKTGIYTVKLKVTDENGLSSSSIKNIKVVNKPTLSPKKPDIVMQSVKAPKTARRGRNIRVRNSVRNNGTLSTGSGFYVAFYLRNTKKSKRYYLGRRWVGKLKPGQSSSVTNYFRTPRKIKRGRYYIQAVADYTKRVNETTRINNIKYTTERTRII
ncbi:MAG: PKD domain-containing protein [Methanobacteriaceae archaeon]|nr:PKD domain-containing protein [Methanobacteriaceae archaeon]